jgi:hypothetical protein
MSREAPLRWTLVELADNSVDAFDAAGDGAAFIGTRTTGLTLDFLEDGQMTNDGWPLAVSPRGSDWSALCQPRDHFLPFVTTPRP